MEGITTILFDIDGTILDTSDFIIKATEHALSTLGYKIPRRSVIASNVGKSFEEYYSILSGSDKDFEKLKELHRAFQFKNYYLVKPFPNSKKVLTYLKNKEYKLGAVTTRSNKTSHQTLINAGIFDFFDTVISNEDVKELKPNPAPLFLALERVGETSEKAVMIGDSDIDIKAGKNAGTRTIRAVYGFHKDNLHDPEPDFIIDDISDLINIL